MNDDLILKAQWVAKAVVDALNGYGIYGVELFIKGDEVIFSEVSPRPHDTGMVTMISQNLSEFALHVKAILGLPIGEIKLYNPSASVALLGTGSSKDISFNNLSEALQLAPNSQIRLFGKPEIQGHRRLGVVLTNGSTVEEAVKLGTKIANSIDIIYN
jgi:phosphoribosylglycinamide formyltransferase 2